MRSRYIQIQTMKGALISTLTIAGFAALTAISARVSIALPNSPVPITFQVLVVQLAALSLGAKAGAASQAPYLAAISAGLPLDAKGLGVAVWTQPTAGYLVGFIAASFTIGRLTEMGFSQNRILRLISGLVGVGVIYMIGVTWLTLGFLGGDWARGWAQGIAPFILIDLAKAVVAAGIAGGVRAWLAEPQGGLM